MNETEIEYLTRKRKGIIIKPYYRPCIFNIGGRSWIMVKSYLTGVSIFENKYKWSGDGNQETLEVLSKIQGHELMEPKTKKLPYFLHQGWKYYYIYLGHELPLGEDVVIEIEQKLEDSSGKFEPFVAKTVTEPMSSLKLRVLIPASCHFHNASNRVLNHSGPNNKVIHRDRSAIQVVHKDGESFLELSFEVQKPRLNRRYEIKWEWVS
jgi:hypothetical protein